MKRMGRLVILSMCWIGLAAVLLPAPLYDRIVLWVRTHTDL